MTTPIRNVAIIAHVDHGKTTLVDEIIKQANLFRDSAQVGTCFMDSNDIERERGITILAKNISVRYRNTKINIIDTPGHSDFGGQVERVLNLADGVLLLVDAAEGPMPQTRFVLDKALQLGLKPVVVINKVDKPDSRVEEVHEAVFDLFVELNATDDQLDFPLLYASGRSGWADTTLEGERNSIIPLMDAIVDHIPPPEMREGPVQMQVASLDYSEFVGRIGIGRVYRGTLFPRVPIIQIKRDGSQKQGQLKQIFTFEGVERREASEVICGDLCAIVGIDNIDISDTIADFETPEALPNIALDEPTLSMIFRVNDSPLFGKEGKYVSSRHIRERLLRECEKDVALRVEEIGGDSFNVSGRGVLHLSILIENMRREGYELTVSKPHVIYKEIDGVKNEPLEILSVDLPSEYAGKAIEVVGLRRGEMASMEQYSNGRTNVSFHIPTRGIIGLRSKIMTATAGEGIVAHRFLHYTPFKGTVPHRSNGVMISMAGGKSVAFAIDALQLRGDFFIEPGITAYEGMIVGEHCKEGDLIVNIQREKALTNMRASGSDKAIKISPARRMSLEESLEYIDEDELVEVTPLSIRLRKKFLSEIDRKRNRRVDED